MGTSVHADTVPTSATRTLRIVTVTLEGPARSAIIIASAGRPDSLARLLPYLSEKFVPESLVILSVPALQDLPPRVPVDFEVVTGARGLPAQRNAGLDVVPSSVDVVFFFDDDAIPAVDYVERAMVEFSRRGDLLAVTGLVLRDGVREGEIAFDDGVEVLAQTGPRDDSQRVIRSLYGCNFGVRAQVAREVRFDERLPLYGWLEDLDFARRVVQLGEIRALSGCRCVHLGTVSGGRTGHGRLGYSQVANPVYLLRKGSLTRRDLLPLLGKPLLRNLVMSVIGPSATDRRRRLGGNLHAVSDLLNGRLAPERATEFN